VARLVIIACTTAEECLSVKKSAKGLSCRRLRPSDFISVLSVSHRKLTPSSCPAAIVVAGNLRASNPLVTCLTALTQVKRETMRMSKKAKFFSSFATAVADLSGKPATFVAAVAIVVIWAVSGPFFGYSETWQLVINTGTTIITFLMVFVLQNSQNRDGKALQAKLDELILTSQAANKFVGIEKLDEQELREMSKTLAAKAECVEDKADEKAVSPNNAVA
jgi:low affinity Fe/Cu permease